jgi:hypothetical protein
MVYNGSEGGEISRPSARALMLDYHNSPAFAANNQTEGILFGKDNIHLLLAQSGCMGIRIYYGKGGTANPDPAQMILVGYDVDGNDMTDLIIDMGMPCPSHCSSASKKI